MQELREDLELDVEVYRLDKVERSPRRSEGHQVVQAATTLRHESRMIKAGSLVVRTAQPLGDLAVYLLEPGSEDGLATWNFFDEGLKDGTDFPVVRLARPAPMFVSPAEPLAEDRGPIRPITFQSQAVAAGDAEAAEAFSVNNVARRRTLAAGQGRPAGQSARGNGAYRAFRGCKSTGEEPCPDSVA